MTHHSKSLSRSQHGYVAGVCEGLGRHFDLNPTIVRLAWIAAVLFFGTGILVYLVMWWVMPREDAMPIEPSAWERDESGRHKPPLMRTEVDRKMLGVCGGLARYWGFDATLVRLAAASLFIVSGPIAVAAYLLAALFMPSSGTSRSPHPIEL